LKKNNTYIILVFDEQPIVVLNLEYVMVDTVNSTFNKPRRRNSLLKRLSRGSSSDEGDEKFPTKVKNMSEYITPDVSEWDHLPYKEGLRSAKETDELNNAHYRETKQEMENFMAKNRKKTTILKSFQATDIEKPPCYVAIFKLHRERNEPQNPRLYEISRTYLEAHGFVILDVSLVGPYGIDVESSKLVEPYKAIDFAKTHAMSNGHDLFTRYMEIMAMKFKPVVASAPPLYPKLSQVNTIPEDGEAFI
jgi:hypothetical protein